jgi:putative intracellular protease/amidase
VSPTESAPASFPRSCSPPPRGSGAGVRVLVLLARAGASCQETFLPIARLREAGAEVTLASLGTAPIRFDATCDVLAFLGRPWSRAWALRRQSRESGELDRRASLVELEKRGELERWTCSFDAVVVPGGHGRELERFLRDSLVLRVVEQIHARGGVIGLQCHATLIASLAHTEGGSLALGRHMVCWPRGPEAVLGALPFVSSTFMPFGRPVADILVEAGARLQRRGGALRGPQAAIDGRVVSSRGPWSTDAFSLALLQAVASARSAAVLPGEAQDDAR